MRIDGVAAMIALEREASLRVESGSRVEIACMSGVLWITHEGDVRDLFLARGESLVSPVRGVTLVTALEPATVRVLDYSAPKVPAPKVAVSKVPLSKVAVSTWFTRWTNALRSLVPLRRVA
jgi:hypothetical protein